MLRTEPPRHTCNACDRRAVVRIVADPELEEWNPISVVELCEGHEGELLELVQKRRADREVELLSGLDVHS